MPLTGITAVRPTADTVSRLLPYGATVGIAQPVYQDASDSNECKPSDANASAATAAAIGIAITPGVDTGYGFVATGGSIILVGATMVVGEQYYVGPTAGEIIASTELATGDRVTLLGFAATATQLNITIKATGITSA